MLKTQNRTPIVEPTRITCCSIAACFAVCLIALNAFAATPKPPNILLILADDLGYGDVSCYNSQAKVQTPNLDRLAKQGIRFTDAHSPATVCTPTRYSILTGRMSFRSGYGGVFAGVGGPCLIEENRLTLPGMLKKAGYATAMFGKWHVGLSFLDKQGERITDRGIEGVRKVDFTRSISDAPIHRGFDQFFGTACCPTTDWLYAYIDGDRIPTPPTKLLDKSTLPVHEYSHDNRIGLKASDFDLEEVDLVFLEKSKQFLRKQTREKPDQPFFLFHSMQAVHLPSFPAKQFQGKTTAGPHGDFIHEMDWVVGELMKTLDELDIADNTLVIFASDNGPEVPTVIAMRRDHSHDGARPWRGVKRDQWEGGHRTPMIVRWPGKSPTETVSSQLVSLTDLFATCAAIVGEKLPNDAAEDSFDLSPALIAKESIPPIRPHLIQQTFSSRHLSIRIGNWKYLDHQGSGGNNYERDGKWGMKPFALPELEPDAPGQLYHLADDPGETKNLFSQHPKTVTKMKAQLELLKQNGRSAPTRK